MPHRDSQLSYRKLNTANMALALLGFMRDLCRRMRLSFGLFIVTISNTKRPRQIPQLRVRRLTELNVYRCKGSYSHDCLDNGDPDRH